MAKEKVASLEDLAALKVRLQQEAPSVPVVPTDTTFGSIPVSNSGSEVNFDELDLDAALASIMGKLRASKEAASTGDEELEAAIARKENARTRLPEFYASRRELTALLAEKHPKLVIAKQHKITDVVASLSVHVSEAQKALDHSNRLIEAIEGKYPDMVAELKAGQDRTGFVQSVLARFAKNETGQYVASSTVNPAPATIDAANTFLTGLITQISTGEKAVLRPRQDGETAVVVTAQGSWVSKYPEILEINELGVALTRYRIAIDTAGRQKIEQWAAGLVKDGYLLSPQMVKAMKEKGMKGLRRNLLDLVENPESGYLFVPVSNHARCTVTSYMDVRRPEVLVRVSPRESAVGYVIKFCQVNVPQLMEDVFGKEGTTRHKVTVTFNNVAELLDEKGPVGRRIPKNLRDALQNALNVATRQRQEWADLAEIRNVSGLEDLRTIDAISQGMAGTAVISLSEYSEEGESRTYPLAMRVVSDGTVVRPGKVTSRSKEGWLYKALKDGAKVTELFARAKDGTFSNAKLQDVVVRNEEFEMDWLLLLAANQHNAELVSAKNGNVGGLCLTVAEGGRDGTFVVTVPVHDRKPGTPRNRRGVRDNGRLAAYVVARSGDTVTFTDGLTGYSRSKLESSGCKFSEPYAIGSLPDFPRYLMRTVLCAVTRTERDKAPAYLLRVMAVVTAVPSGSQASEAPVDPVDDEPVNESVDEGLSDEGNNSDTDE
ncbi:MAG: hypothetical protein Q8R40_02910 [bacterium]|nr:hypothetical protein [bacterium]